MEISNATMIAARNTQIKYGIGHALEKMPLIEIIYLDDTRIGDNDGFTVICNALAKMSGLRELSLSQSSITTTALKYFSNMLPLLTQLQYLNLGDNDKIGEEGWKAFAFQIQNLTNMQHIAVRDNSLSDSSLLYLLPSIVNMMRLSVLNLSRNRISDNGFQNLILYSKNLY